MRGQISLDFLLAITVALIATGAILAVSGQISQTQAQASARQQLDGIGNSLGAVISYSALLNEADSASIEFDIPGLLIAGEAVPQPCTIIINTDNNTIDLSYDIIDTETGLSENVSVAKHFVNPVGMSILPTSAECGGSIQITKS
ncbi:MAG: hypothetical protein WC634_04580 [archaeon]